MTNTQNRTDLLEYVGSVTTPATSTPFVVREQFKTIEEGGICSVVDSEFHRLFGDKVEEPIGERTLHCFRLRKSAPDEVTIISRFWFRPMVEVTMTELHGMMMKRWNHEEGVLLLSAKANVFYIRDAKNILRRVYVVWGSVGWFVHARTIEDSVGWNGNQLICSRSLPKALTFASLKTLLGGVATFLRHLPKSLAA